MTEPSYTLHQLTLLVVDDQDPMRKSIKRLGQNMGFGEVLECHNGESALQLLAERPVDIIITDLYMKKVSGIQLLEFVRGREMGGEIPVIIVTGEAGQDDIVKAANKGAKHYLLKPFHSTDLEKKITRALEDYFSPSTFLKELRLGERSFLLGKTEAARDYFERARALDPSSARAVHGLALSLMKLNFDDKAVALLENCLELNPSYYRAYGSLADIHLKGGRIKEAIAAMLRELQINPKDLPRQIKVAHMLLKQGNPLEALQHYRLALKEDPKRMAALMGMGYAMAQIGNLDKALYYFRRVRRYYPTATKALEAGVRACMGTDDWQKAEMFLKEEKATHPKQIDAYLLLATLYFKQKRNDAALDLANDMLSKTADPLQALQIKSTALLNLELYDEALPVLKEVSQTAPTTSLFSQIAAIQLKKNSYDEALKSLHDALALQEGHPQPFLLLAEHLKASRCWLEATLMYRRAEALGASPEDCQKKIFECLQKARARRSRQGLGPLAS